MERNMVFVSYSHDDMDWKHAISVQLEVLERQNLLQLWCDTDIEAGQDWYDEIDRALLSAKIAVLIITANFLTSDFILNEEVPKILERHQDDGMSLMPILASDCLYQAVPWISPKQIRPWDAKPLDQFRKPQRNSELAKIAQEVLKLLNGE